MSYLPFVHVAAAVSHLTLGEPQLNAEAMIRLAAQADTQGAAIVVFPELSLSGYTLGDLVLQPSLLQAVRDGLTEMTIASRSLACALIVGLPLQVENALYNVAAVVARGRIVGIVPKSYLPNYQEFYDARWYRSGFALPCSTIELNEGVIPIGTDLLFEFPHVKDFTLGIEICEDLWAPLPPSSLLAPRGATVIANLSASNELAGKAAYRHQLIAQQSARLRAGYVYASSGLGESTTDLVFSGDALIAENGQIIAQSKRLDTSEQLVISDIDITHLVYDRTRTTTYTLPPELSSRSYRRLQILTSPRTALRTQTVDPHPFIPPAGPKRDERTQEVFALQVAALSARLKQSGLTRLVLGLSGGLDSTLALLVSLAALKQCGLAATNLELITIPGLATSEGTRTNAGRLAAGFSLQLREIAIAPSSVNQLKELGHDGLTQDITYENVQARYRTALLFGRANVLGALVVGTGDLSEIALGWATFNGDHISHYHVNAGVPKTLVSHLIAWAATQDDFRAVKEVLHDVLSTPISPELTARHTGTIDQSTEDIIGPYELTDFYLYHFIRWGDEPTKMLDLATVAFKDQYTRAELTSWLRSFLTRFFASQWKRSVMPDGPKVGSVSLSPRGDWRMPSAIRAKAWLDELQ